MISTIEVDGHWLLVSKYQDQIWKLTVHTTNTRTSRGVIDFSTVPAPFQTTVKAILYRYLRRGLAGSPGPAKPITVARRFGDIRLFLRYVSRWNIECLADISPLICANYVLDCKQEKSGKTKKLLAASSLVQRFLAVEAIYELSQFTSDPMLTHPWIESSATILAGFSGVGPDKDRPKTALIGDEDFSTIFQCAWSMVERGEEILKLNSQLKSLSKDYAQLVASSRIRAKQRHLITDGYVKGVNEFNKEVVHLRTACYIVVASLSGCRNHELAFIQKDACYSTTADDGTIYWWMRSQSKKTDAGHTEWMIPEAAVRALQVMELWAEPMQLLVGEEISTRRKANPEDPEIAEAQRHVNALFLGADLQKGNRIRTLSVLGWNRALKAFSEFCGVKWKLKSHQFRRKFANYAARSKFGDLRYLREHFKHWSFDMSLGYALNENQEILLYMEIEDELDAVKRKVADSWLSDKEPLAGGYGKSLINWRQSDSVNIFKDHKHMVKSIAASTAIRSNGHAWCTADDSLCIGNNIEPTRCSDCSNAVIGRTHQPLYQGLYDHLKEVATRTDIGESGIARVTRDLARCRSVLISLGYDPEGYIQ